MGELTLTPAQIPFLFCFSFGILPQWLIDPSCKFKDALACKVAESVLTDTRWSGRSREIDSAETLGLQVVVFPRVTSSLPYQEAPPEESITGWSISSQSIHRSWG